MEGSLIKEVKQEEKDFKIIWRRIKNRDFSGNTGLAVKNSIYQLSTQIIAKIGSLIFTIILARLLMPELFGLYNLALSTILIFVAFSQLGISQAIVTFISRETGKKGKNTYPYIVYLGKIKATLILISAILLLVSAKYLSYNFYKKPILLPLLIGAVYIFSVQTVSFLQYLMQASNFFKGLFKREIVFQVLRVMLVPLAIVFSTTRMISSEKTIMLVILALSISLFATAFLLFFDVKKLYFNAYKNNSKKLPKSQKKSANKFILATAILALSGIFFSHIDKIMLGRFVQAEFIGYYTASFGLVGAMVPLVGFSAIVLLPIFSRLKGKQLEKGFTRSVKITFLMAFGLFLAVLLLAPFAISLIYGKEYMLSVNILRVLSILLVILPLIGIYSSYFISIKKPQVIAKLLLISTLFNIILNYFFITSLLAYGDLIAVYGVSVATLISQGILFMGLVLKRNKK